MKIINREFPQPFIYFLIAILFILISVIPGNKKIIEFHIADTYFIVAAILIERQLALGFILLATFCFFIYKLPVSKAIAWIHIALTITGLIIFLFGSFVYNQNIANNSALEYNRGMKMLSGDAQTKVFIAAAGIILMILAQIVLFMNLMVGLIRQFNRN